jgi:hypothetical protein
MVTRGILLLDKNSVTIVTIGNGMMVESTIIDGTMREDGV